jgi:hypothetical protein
MKFLQKFTNQLFLVPTRANVKGDKKNLALLPLSSSLRDCVAIHQRQRCHAEQSEASRIFKLLRRRDSSPAAQNDITTQSLKAEETNSVHAGTVAFILAVALLVLLSPRHGDAQQREKVRVALGSISVNTSVIPVGHQYGIFAKYGVDLEPIYMGGGMNSLAAVTSNTVQFLSAGSTATISARLGGIDIVMLTVQSNKLDYSVFTAAEIKSPQDLKGKIVTGTRPGASADSALRLYLRRAGLVPDKDVSLFPWGIANRDA